MARLIRKDVAGIRIEGFSLAGEETVIAAPEYNVCFDIGRAPREVISIDTVCLTHGHMDHAAGLAYYFSQRSFVGNPPGRVIVHRGLAQPIQALMGVWADIEGHHSPMDLCAVEPLEDVTIRRNLLIRPFAVDHGACALGFTLIEVRHKLKEEFLGKSGQHLVELKKKGVEIEERIEVPLITNTGDTAIGSFLEHRFVQTSRVVLVECTFFEPEHITRARAGRHIHIMDLPRVLEAIPDASIILTHLTRRTDLRLAKDILKKAISPRDLDRTCFLMERPPRSTSRRNPASERHERENVAAPK